MLETSFDISRFRQAAPAPEQYERQLRRLIATGKEVQAIESAVRGALRNLSDQRRASFVVYGEPQSGKTEMMICLTAKLLDEGRRFVLHLLNDSVDLLSQNLGRFQDSGLAPSAQNYTEILDPEIRLENRHHVIFCKKNQSDLQKLLNKIGKLHDIVIVDDEADFASPNAKINQAEQTRINSLISSLLGSRGDYIGVTATPARLDLNNTFDNDNQLWVNFPTHKLYTGQDIFFPLEGPTPDGDTPYQFQLTLLPEKGDDSKYPRQALFSFLVNVAYLNLYVNERESNYSMLIHTSGKKVDHKGDWSTVQDTLATLVNTDDPKFALTSKKFGRLRTRGMTMPTRTVSRLTSWRISLGTRLSSSTRAGPGL
jgi:SWI2/SNF2 ATPase